MVELIALAQPGHGRLVHQQRRSVAGTTLTLVRDARVFGGKTVPLRIRTTDRCTRS